MVVMEQQSNTEFMFLECSSHRSMSLVFNSPTGYHDILAYVFFSPSHVGKDLVGMLRGALRCFICGVSKRKGGAGGRLSWL